jgi:hypothetical protein
MLNLDRDVEILKALVKYYVLNRAQIQRLFFASSQGDRIARRRLQELVSERLINRTQVQVMIPGNGSPAPAYYPARKGCDLLAEHLKDERFYSAPTQSPNPHHLFHWLSISDVHITLDESLSRQTDAACLEWLNEWDIANKDEQQPEKRYRIYTLIQDNPRLVCAPDAAMLLSVRGQSKTHYLELDRNTSGVRQIAASKTPGYAMLAERQLHRRHFPQATLGSFSVLMVTTTPNRRDLLAKGIAEKPGAALWRFACITDLTPDTFLSAPVWYRCDGQTVPLVKPPAEEAS